jgi:hydrogenase small subunit
VTSPRRPPVIWLAGQACTGCTESLLRPSHPSLEHLSWILSPLTTMKP